MRRCPSCSIEKSFADFHKDSSSKSGYQTYCKTCVKNKNSGRNGYQSERNIQRVELLAQIKLERGCADCGYNEYAVALHFDHRDSSNKVRDVTRLRNGNMEKLLAEIEKCDVVCANCHAVRTARRGNWHGEY